MKTPPSAIRKYVKREKGKKDKVVNKKVCPICGIYIVRLKSHLERHNKSVKNFKCELCPQRFIS